ncbi:MAG: GtrA family protein [Coriobacteriales bacterium]|jgi:putative flippase GtrA|nr:GtrA family protein [Coriobacteriales bacterium]
MNNLIRNQKVRFVLIGGMNTILDFAILNILSMVLSAVAANTVSTGITMAISFVLNKKYTFEANSKNYAREVFLFILFTLFGLWVLQNLVITGLLMAIPDNWPEVVRLNGAKLIATGVSMVWNFLAYKHIVFKH